MPPSAIESLLQQAMELQRAGQLEAADSVYRQVLSQDLTNPDASYGLGMSLYLRGRAPEAVDWLRQAMRSRDDLADGHIALMRCLAQAGRLPEAVEHGRAVEKRLTSARPSPQGAAILAELSHHLAKANDPIGAEASAGRAVAMEPRLPAAHIALGVCRAMLQRKHEAVDAFRRAIELDPANAVALTNLGAILTELDELDEALLLCRRAVELQPNYPTALHNLGFACQQCGLFGQAESVERRACQLRPEFVAAHWGLAISLLTRGNYTEGFREYEWRERTPQAANPRRQLPSPRWRGQDLPRGTLLVSAEQGFGDFIQFARYVPIIAPRVGKLILQCAPELDGLARSLRGPVEFIRSNDPLPKHDAHVPIGSLALECRSELATIPNHVPYLTPPHKLAQDWAASIGDVEGARKVGLVWAGEPSQFNDRRRSTRLSQWSVLGEIANVRWFSFQKGPGSEQIRTPPAGMRITDLSPRLTNFAQSAAAMSAMDLIITVDTAAAHLAGALGRPAWVLLSHVADWRWLENQNDSPWYPTMRLFRQPAQGDWKAVFSQLASELRQVIHERHGKESRA